MKLGQDSKDRLPVPTPSLPQPLALPSLSRTLSEVLAGSRPQLAKQAWQAPGELLNAMRAGGLSLPSGPPAGNLLAQTLRGHRRPWGTGDVTLGGYALPEAGFGWWTEHKWSTPVPELPSVGVRGELYVGHSSWECWGVVGGMTTYF